MDVEDARCVAAMDTDLEGESAMTDVARTRPQMLDLDAKYTAEEGGFFLYAGFPRDRLSS
jgi:hypothetical protein